MKNTILITGASGFVGQNLISSFREKYDIRILSTQNAEKSEFICYNWSQLDLIPFDEIETIIHLAGKAHDVKGTSGAEEYFEINTNLTKKLYAKFLESEAKRFVFLSSVKAVADVVTDVLREDVEPSPVGAYGLSKLKAEEYLLSQNRKEKDVYILRPCMIHGPGNKGNLNLLYNVIKKKVPYPLGAFQNKRSFVSIENLIFIVERMLTLRIESGVYNIADDEPLSTKELVDTISDTLNYSSRIWNIPKGLIILLAKIGDVTRLPFNSFSLEKLTETYIVDNTKIKRALGVDKLPKSSRDGIAATIKSFMHG